MKACRESAKKPKRGMLRGGEYSGLSQAESARQSKRKHEFGPAAPIICYASWRGTGPATVSNLANGPADDVSPKATQKWEAVSAEVLSQLPTASSATARGQSLTVGVTPKRTSCRLATAARRVTLSVTRCALGRCQVRRQLLKLKLYVGVRGWLRFGPSK